MILEKVSFVQVNNTTKCGKVIICFETWGVNVSRDLVRGISVFFPNINHHFYVGEIFYKYSFKKYYGIVNDEERVNSPKLPELNTYITYYNNFTDPNSPITKYNDRIYISTIALIICRNEVTSLMFKANINPGYVNEKIDF
jgi:hypothetical protein